jgi:hypothetical protein
MRQAGALCLMRGGGCCCNRPSQQHQWLQPRAYRGAAAAHAYGRRPVHHVGGVRCQSRATLQHQCAASVATAVEKSKPVPAAANAVHHHGPDPTPTYNSINCLALAWLERCLLHTNESLSGTPWKQQNAFLHDAAAQCRPSLSRICRKLCALANMPPVSRHSHRSCSAVRAACRLLMQVHHRPCHTNTDQS